MRYNIFLFLAIFMAACNPMADENAQSVSYYQTYFQKQIDTLLMDGYGVLRHTTEMESEEVDQVQLDSMSKELWEQELRGFIYAGYVDELDTANYYFASDKSGKFEIRRFTAKDTLAHLQQWEETKVNGTIQLITWQTQKRSVLMDRWVEMAYQPLKGYRIRMKEDAAWSAPRDYEIFAEFIK